MKYFSPRSKGFYCSEINAGFMPEDVIQLTDELYTQLLDELGRGYDLVFDGKLPKTIKHVITADETINSKIAEANKYLQDTDFYFTVDKYAQLTDEKKLELTILREAKRDYIRVNS